MKGEGIRENKGGDFDQRALCIHTHFVCVKLKTNF